MADLSKYKIGSPTPAADLSKYKTAAPPPDRRGSLEKFTDFIGAKGLTNYLGSAIARTTAPQEHRPLIKKESGKEALGSALQVGSIFLPFGAAARGASLGLRAAGMTRGATVAGNVASGALGGAVYDTGSAMQGQEGVGAGTALGAAIPLVPPALRGVARVASESLGVSTGVGGGVTRQLFGASRAGGADAAAAKNALRGNTSPDAIVSEARDAIGTIVQNRTSTYQNNLSKIADDKRALDVSPIIQAIDTNLAKFRIGFKDGALDFSQSAIRFDKKAQQEVATIIEEMKAFGTRPGDRTAVGVDALKRALGDLYSDSSNVRAFVASVNGATRKVLSAVKGYDEMSDAYSKSTQLIKEIHKGLSLGDKAQTDTAFRKLASALRVNNEFRKQLVTELDQAIPGNPLSAKIAGQQMSEMLPRGIMRQIGGVGALGGLLTGVGIVPILKAALVTSPRIVGELLYALGYTARQVDKITGTLKGRSAFPGDVLLNSVQRPKNPGQSVLTASSSSASPALNATPSSNSAPITPNVSMGTSVPKTKKKASDAVPKAPLGATKPTKPNGDKPAALGKADAWPDTTASKQSKAGSTSTGSAPTGKEGVSAQKAGTSGPFDGAEPIKVYHGTVDDTVGSLAEGEPFVINPKKPFSVTTNKKIAEKFSDLNYREAGEIGAPVVHEFYLSPTARILETKDIPPQLAKDVEAKLKAFADTASLDQNLEKLMRRSQNAITSYARKNGYDAVRMPTGAEDEIVVLNVASLKTKAELPLPSASKELDAQAKKLSSAFLKGGMSEIALREEIARAVPKMERGLVEDIARDAAAIRENGGNPLEMFRKRLSEGGATKTP